MLTLKTVYSLAVLWHICAFAAGGVYVFHAYRVLFYGGHNPAGLKVIRTADVQLWISGLTVIGLGMLVSDVATYAENPKLWAKLMVVSIWFASTQIIRRYAVRRLRDGDRLPMLLASALNVSCWVYGAFLGVSKPLAAGEFSFSSFVFGFDLVFAVSLLVTIGLENRKQSGLIPPKPKN